tara:strand:+ start:12473 stop:13150 length:678 start_codon:yes stop_codon:yes gene_type:complete
MSSKKKFWSGIVGEDWYNAFPGIWESEYMANVMEHVMKLYKSTTLYPESKDLFKPFKLCPYDKLKVVILGDHPYMDGNATGLAFGNPEESLMLSKPIKAIEEAIENDVYDGLNLDFDVTLESWAEQGVLLLNECPTAEKFNPEKSHHHIWKKFIQGVMLGINLHNNGIHFTFWGQQAQQFTQFVVEDEDRGNYIHCSSYPEGVNDVWKCNNFSEINNKLKQKIVW